MFFRWYGVQFKSPTWPYGPLTLGDWLLQIPPLPPPPGENADHICLFEDKFLTLMNTCSCFADREVLYLITVTFNWSSILWKYVELLFLLNPLLTVPFTHKGQLLCLQNCSTTTQQEKTPSAHSARSKHKIRFKFPTPPRERSKFPTPHTRYTVKFPGNAPRADVESSNLLVHNIPAQRT